jgi:hypothetical protein
VRRTQSNVTTRQKYSHGEQRALGEVRDKYQNGLAILDGTKRSACSTLAQALKSQYSEENECLPVTKPDLRAGVVAHVRLAAVRSLATKLEERAVILRREIRIA